ncbi:MAG: adenylate/guanylate cyclase domain-containing protein [Minwuia sp.]|nr:adenylate/guanylate cyclase domain-containing protein [Minwuia sp.]
MSEANMPQSREEASVNIVTTGWRADATVRWLLDDLHRPNAELDFLTDLCARLNTEGLDLQRVFCGLLSLHPLYVSRNLIWRPGKEAEVVLRGHDAMQSEYYLKSPIHLIHQGSPQVRQRLDMDDDLLEFDIWRELKAEGTTDYIALPLRFSTGEVNVISFATRRPGGYDAAHIERLKELVPLMSLRFELMNAYFATGSLLGTYLGEAAARRVLAGTIHRAEGEALRAAIYLCDLRGFTRLSDRLEGPDIIEILDDYFDCMIEPVKAMGGEVLKFMGDGMLAIFPMDDRTAWLASHSALAAAVEGVANLADLNRKRKFEGKPELKVGIGLNVGDVIFGNIGSADRLDFTVIGRAVNEVSRVETLTRPLNRPILMTEAFAKLASQGTKLESLGFHALPGVSQPSEIFSPA